MPHATILYVEDEPLLRISVAEMLSEEGWRVVSCAHGRAALARIEGGEHFDLLVLDNGLPGVSGLELLRRARALEHRRATPVVIFSAGDCEREARESGADAFLRKPRDVRRLARVVAALLSARG
jgi:CheY-like chemotaxis protein